MQVKFKSKNSKNWIMLNGTTPNSISFNFLTYEFGINIFILGTQRFY